jgi:hypothetical protein
MLTLKTEIAKGLFTLNNKILLHRVVQCHMAHIHIGLILIWSCGVVQHGTTQKHCSCKQTLNHSVQTAIHYALTAWHSGHCVRLVNRRSRVRIPPGCKVFRSLYIAVLLSGLNLNFHCVYLRKIHASKKTYFKPLHFFIFQAANSTRRRFFTASAARCTDFTGNWMLPEDLKVRF